jgi:DNA sulfur modification protein DndD
VRSTLLSRRESPPILYLLRKPDFVHRVQIDTETFKLSLYDQDGELLPKHRLSAGEKQILAIALLWGLAQASGCQLPVAIDTQLRLHLHRGIGYLAGDPHLKHIQNLCHLALQHTTPE